MMSAGSITKFPLWDRRRWRRSWSDTARSWPSPGRDNSRLPYSPMDSEPSIRRYRSCYAKLLRLYPKHYRARFGEGMEQTFNDLCRERVKAQRGIFGFALWMFGETALGIIRENASTVMQKKIIVRPAIGAGIIVL